MKLKQLLLVILGLTFGISSVNAQIKNNFTCDHEKNQEKFWEENPDAKKDYLELINNSKTTTFQNGRKRTKLIIPVVFHVIHNDGDENISDQEIIDHLKIVNNDYQKLNADTNLVDPAFKDIIANCGIEFRLATIDPLGNCTSGITHTKSVLTYNADDYSKFHQWDRKKYLNIWIINNFSDPRLGGYAFLPTEDGILNSYFFADGVILLSQTINKYERTLTHEIGHYLGLRHIFYSYKNKNNNKTGGSCSDDYIDDTPSTRGGAYNSKTTITGIETSNKKKYSDSLCDVSIIPIVFNFDQVTKSSGASDAQLSALSSIKIPVDYDINNYLLDSNSQIPTFPAGAKTIFSTNNLSLRSALKTKIAFSLWPLKGKGIDTTKYYQLDYISSTGNSIDFNGLKLVYSRNNSGVRNICIKSSLDNFKSNLPISSTDTYLNVVNNIATLKKDTSKMVSVNVNLNNPELLDFRDGKKISFRIYGWNADTTTGTFNIDTLLILGNSSKLYTPGMKAVGLSANSLVEGKFAFSNWALGGKEKDTVLLNQTGQLNPSKYYEFKIQPYKRKLVNVDSIIFNVSRNLNGVRSFSVKSSIDNYKNDLLIESNSKLLEIKNNQAFIKKDTNLTYQVKLNLTKIAVDNRESNPITFRIYGWNADSLNGTLEIDSLNIFTFASTIENYENYMDYTACRRMFTLDQSNLMNSILTNRRSIRNSLIKDANLTQTGTLSLSLTTPVCKPVAYFSSDKKYACVDEEITFNDKSWNSKVVSRLWRFEDSNIETSEDLNPKVSFKSPGYKKVTLKVTNSNGVSDSLVETKYIYISGKTSEINNIFSQNFDNGIPSDWLIENYENNEVKFQSGNGRWGSKGLKLNIYKNTANATPINESDYFYHERLRDNQDAVVSPSVNFKIINEAYLHFDYAYATSGYYDSLISEKLNIKYTEDCGKTWKTLQTKDLNNELITAGIVGNKDFNVINDDMWKTAVIDLKSIPHIENIRFKVEFISSKSSNNLYIDNINLFGVVGIQENPLNTMDFNIVPNPTSNDNGINIMYTANDKSVAFELIDLQGKVIAKETNNVTNTTVSHSLKLINQLNSGYYTLRISQGEFVVNKKLIIQ